MGALERWGERWTPEEDATLAALLSAGLTIPEAAERMGRTEPAVRKRAAMARRAAGVPAPKGGRKRAKLTEQQARRARAMSERGMSVWAIHVATGWPRRAVAEALRGDDDGIHR